MDKAEIAISVDRVYKDFVLPHEKVGSVKNAFTGMLRSIHSKRSYGVQHALQDITFDIKKGEFFGIVGRNGSGKSTLLKILAGIYQPTGGSVTVRGKLVPFIELGVGFNPELTGRENVYLNGAMLGFSTKEIDSMYQDVVTFAELDKFMDQKLKNYSSGMQVRLAFSMAIRAQADILLVDEVLAVGDADFQRKCYDYFRTLKREKKTVVFVSHDMNAVREYCDRAIMIERTRIIARGSADSIAKKYTRMFMEKDSSGSQQKAADNRWGNEHAILRKVDVAPKKLFDKKKQLKITAIIQSNIRINNLILGFSISAPDGRPLLGTNTKVEKINTGSWNKGQQKQIIWSLPNIFPDGKYEITIAILEQDGITVCDWYDGAASFQSFTEEHTPFYVQPLFTTVIKEVKNGNL